MVSRSKSRKLRLVKSTPAGQTLAATENGTDVEPREQPRLKDLMLAADEAFSARDWAKLLELSRHAPEAIHADDRETAGPWLLNTRAWALVQNGEVRYYSLSREARDELEQALLELAPLVDRFYETSVFSLYLDVLCGPWVHMPAVLEQLIAACRQGPTRYWLALLREQLFRLAVYPADELVPERDAVRALFPEPLKVLQEVYDVIDRHTAITKDVLQLVAVGKLELEVYFAEPWDLPEVASRIRALPSPSVHEILEARRLDEAFARRAPMSPHAWAFMVELRHTPIHQLNALLDRYPSHFCCPPCDALRLIAASIGADALEADDLLRQGAEILFEYATLGNVWFGTSLVFKAETGIEECDVGYQSLYMASDVPAVLLRLFEQVPENHRNSAELGALYHGYVAYAEGMPLDADSNDASYAPGIAWLTDNSLALQLAFSRVLPEYGQRLTALVEGIARTVEESVQVPAHFRHLEEDAEPLSDVEAGELMVALQHLAAVRSELSGTAAEIWRKVAGRIFTELSMVDGVARSDEVQLARTFQADLLETGYAFRLAYLEQVAGDKYLALQHYLTELEASDKDEKAAVGNMRLLWHKSEEASVVAQMVSALEAVSGTHRRADIIQGLLKDAKARRKALERDEQFQRTAINRWPSLTPPARKLLGVLATITRYSSLDELAQYAGMDKVWVSRHYGKLVETGMVLEHSEGSYAINPHIKPLIEKESQHAVVGRIVRAQGTSAVKQVFNSQREFTIYQVMMQLCPNHLIFPNCSLQSIMSFDRMKSLVDDDDFNYYLRAGVDLVVVSSTTYLPLLAVEVDSVWHETEKQQRNDVKKDRLFAAAGIPFMRLQPVGTPSEGTIRAQVAEHLDELVRALREDLPGYDQARLLLNDLSTVAV